MEESFEAVVFGMSDGTWSIVQRQGVPALVDGVRWVRSVVARLGDAKGYQRFRARVISSTDDDTAEDILRSLKPSRERTADGHAPQPLKPQRESTSEGDKEREHACSTTITTEPQHRTHPQELRKG